VDTAPKRLHQALDVEVLGLPRDYHSAYAENVAKVTAESATAAVQRRVSPADVLVVVVGTAADIREAVEKAIGGLASTNVVQFDADDGAGDAG
jgi:predicted Zn-dependent peptidase